MGKGTRFRSRESDDLPPPALSHTRPLSPPPRLSAPAQNIDHLFGPEYPMFTAAQTSGCCNGMSPTVPSGGFWVVEPDTAWGVRAWELMVRGKPERDRDGVHLTDPATGAPLFGVWRLSDLDLVKAMFTTPLYGRSPEVTWPFADDQRHGVAPGVRSLPEVIAMPASYWPRFTSYTRVGTPRPEPEGFRPERWDGVTPVWHALDIKYDYCVGMCECFPGRDLRDGYASVHFSCIPFGLHKPSWYATEAELFADMYSLASSCTRWCVAGGWHGRVG